MVSREAEDKSGRGKLTAVDSRGRTGGVGVVAIRRSAVVAVCSYMAESLKSPFPPPSEYQPSEK